MKANGSSIRRLGKTVAQRLHESSLKRAEQRSRLGGIAANASVVDRQDWTHARERVLQTLLDNESARMDHVYSLAYSAPADRSLFPAFDTELDEQMREQLRISRGQLMHSHNNKATDAPLPRTLDDAIREQHSNRALVVTEIRAPFRIVNVNKAWEGLCEYTYVESKGRNLGDLLRGPDTDQSAVTAIMSILSRGEEAGTILTNYTKSGRKFRNRLRVGPLFDERGDMSYFVGELNETSM